MPFVAADVEGCAALRVVTSRDDSRPQCPRFTTRAAADGSRRSTDGCLFVSDRGGEGRLKVGDEVRVQKTSGVFGRKYRITGPSRRPFTALRIRCERPDLNEENRRRSLLLSR